MNLVERFTRSWTLFKVALRVIFSNRKLLLFPLATFFAVLGIALFFFAVPILAYVTQPTGHGLFEAAHWHALANSRHFFERLGAPENHVILSLATFLYVVAIYFTSVFVATFCNVAFYNEIMKVLAGEQPSLRSGLAFASKRLHSILLWSLFAGTVGLLMRMIAERLGFIGKIIMRFVGIVWSVACVFVIPIIIREDIQNPIELLKLSAGTLKKTWGESLAGYVGVGSVSVLLFLTVLFWAFTGLIVGGTLHSPVIMVAGVVMAALFALAGGILIQVAGHVYRCALYVYATEGVVPEPFDADLLNSAWKIK